MSKADELKAKMARLRAATQAASPGHHPEAPATPASAAPAPRPQPAAETVQVKPVRLTLDLSPARYRDLQSWLNDSAVRLGRSRVTKQEALNALVALLLSDERTTQMVLREIRDSQ